MNWYKLKDSKTWHSKSLIGEFVKFFRLIYLKFFICVCDIIPKYVCVNWHIRTMTNLKIQMKLFIHEQWRGKSNSKKKRKKYEEFWMKSFVKTIVQYRRACICSNWALFFLLFFQHTRYLHTLGSPSCIVFVLVCQVCWRSLIFRLCENVHVHIYLGMVLLLC